MHKRGIMGILRRFLECLRCVLAGAFLGQKYYKSRKDSNQGQDLESRYKFLYIKVIASPSLIHYRLKTRVTKPDGFEAKEFFSQRKVSVQLKQNKCIVKKSSREMKSKGFRVNVPLDPITYGPI